MAAAFSSLVTCQGVFSSSIRTSCFSIILLSNKGVTNLAQSLHMFFAISLKILVTFLRDKEINMTIEKVAVIGGGTMGSGIAEVAAKSGCNTIVVEIDAS